MRKLIRCVVCAFALCVPSAVTAQWTPDPFSAVGMAATDAWLASQPVDPLYTAVEGFKGFVSAADVPTVALEIAGNPNTTIGELEDVDLWWDEFDAEKALGDADFAAAVVKRDLARNNWNEGWQWALAGTSSGNAVAVLKFAACCTNSAAAIAKFNSASDHYDQCFLNYASLILLRNDVRTRIGVLIP